MKILPLLFVLSVAVSTAFAGMGKINIERKRVEGRWEVHCDVAYPDDNTELERTIGYLRTQCEIAALRLAVKHHSRSGDNFDADVTQEKFNSDKSRISVVARLVQKNH